MLSNRRGRRLATTALAMVVTIAMVTLALGATGSATARGTSAPASVPSSHLTIVVKPNGVDDTADIQAAFNTCVSHSPGCTVRLLLGTYYISSQITVYGFQGSFVGAGQRLTTIVAPDAMPSPNPVYNVPCVGYPSCTYLTGPGSGIPWWAGYPGMGPDGSGSPKGSGTANPWPAIFTFVGGSIAVSAMTITDTSSTPTQGWYWPAIDGGGWNTALIAAIEITGFHAFASINEVTLVGAAGDYGGFNDMNGIHIEGAFLPGEGILPPIWTNPEAQSIPLTGTFSVTNTVSDNVQGDAFVNYVVNANATICGNTAIDTISEPLFAFVTMDLSNSNVLFCGNTGTVPMGAGIVSEQSVHMSGLLPSTVYIVNNDFQAIDGANAVDLFDFGVPSTLNAVVSGNVFMTDTSCGCIDPTIPSYYSVIISEGLASLSVSLNTISDGGSAGVYIVGGPATVVANAILDSYVGVWVDYANSVSVAGNLVKDSAEYGIAVTDGSSNNTVAFNFVKGSGAYDLYWDGTGTGNVWIGNFHKTSSPSGLG